MFRVMHSALVHLCSYHLMFATAKADAITVVLIVHTVSEQLSAQYGAVKMLHSRMRLVLDYLKAMQCGKQL